MPSIVQFFHPGQEHGYDKKYRDTAPLFKDWHTVINGNGKPIDHRRKFILNEGTFIKDDKKHEGKLLFWGEWEPPSKVFRLEKQSFSPPYGKNPEYLHKPFLPPADQLHKYQNAGIYQNTDPFIFGDCFIWAICRQKNKSLQELKEGSIIIFGSKVNHRFVIDTVFVIKSMQKYRSLDNVRKMNLGIYSEIVTKLIVDENNKVHNPDELTLYKGATYDNPINDMFSFVPVKVYENQAIGFSRFFMPDDFYKTHYKNYFQRSFIENGLIYEEGMMGIKHNKNKTMNEIFEFWKYLKNKISRNHVLGVNFKMPEEDKTLILNYPFTEFKFLNGNGSCSGNVNKKKFPKC